MSSSQPLRFLMAVTGGWICLRAAMLLPEWRGEPPPALARPETRAASSAPLSQQPPDVVPLPRPPPQLRVDAPPLLLVIGAAARAPAFAETKAALAAAASIPAPSTPVGSRPVSPAAAPYAPLQPTPAASRWSGSAWLFVREGGASSLGTGGTLGGSQIGARLFYLLNSDAGRPLSLTARLYSPLEAKGAEAAVGVEWQPVAALPVRLLAERRQKLDAIGRSAFALLAYGGVSDKPIAGPVLLDGYAQAGMVGLHSRDLFADGSAQLGIPLDPKRQLKAGVGIWGAAQPGASRLDAGPQASLRVPVGDGAVRLSAEWRFRIAGEAAPASGPALTLASEF